MPLPIARSSAEGTRSPVYFLNREISLNHPVDAINLRQELKPFGIKCSILEPGAFKTPFLDQDAMKNRVEETWSKLDDKIRTDYGEAFKNYCE